MKSKVHCCPTATLPTLESHTVLRLNGVQKAVNAVLQQAGPEQAWTAATAFSRALKKRNEQNLSEAVQERVQKRRRKYHLLSEDVSSSGSDSDDELEDAEA
jgi:hypothetical protein